MAASASDYFQKVGMSTATTLSAPGYTTGNTSINVASTTNWPTDTGVTFAIDTIDSAGERVAGSYNIFRGTVASATSITNVTYVGGDANQNYSAGTTTRVYILVSYAQTNRLIDGLLVDHSQSGGHEIATNYDPANPTLETQKWVGVSSAVNEVTVTNATTGNGPTVSSSGGDTNVDLNIDTKGSGVVKFASTVDLNGQDIKFWNGWLASPDTWTYASATSFTISGIDRTALFPVGTKIKLTQTTDKYFYVTSTSFSTNTTVNITGGSDYSLANAAITSPYYSYAETPQGFPQFFNYTATWTNLTVGNGTGVYRFKMSGKEVTVRLEFVLGSTSSVSTGPNFTLPTTSSTTGYTGAAAPQIGVGTIYDSGSAFYPAVVHWNSSTTARFRVQNAGATYLTQADITSSVPMASWATGDTLSCEIIYESA